MRYIIVVFWSRSEAFFFANLLKKSSIPTALIPTPKQAGRTCGLSVQIPEDYFDFAKQMIKSNRFQSFGGFFEKNENNQIGKVARIRFR